MRKQSGKFRKQVVAVLLVCLIFVGCGSINEGEMNYSSAVDTAVHSADKSVDVTEAPVVTDGPVVTNAPTDAPVVTETPTVEPTAVPTEEPALEPTEVPTAEPTEAPTPEPTEVPTPEPTEVPTPEPTEVPTPEATEVPTPEPTEVPTAEPTEVPTPEPTEVPTPEPTEVEISHTWAEVSSSETTNCFLGITTITKNYRCTLCDEEKEEQTETTAICDWQWIPIDYKESDFYNCEHELTTYYTCVIHGTMNEQMVQRVPGPGHDVYVSHTVRNECRGTVTAFYACRNCKNLGKAPETIEYFEGTWHIDIDMNAVCDTCGETCLPGDHRCKYETISIQEVSCENSHIEVVACTICGREWTYTYESAWGHDYVMEVVGATCSQYGVEVYTCSRCSRIYTRDTYEFDPNNHDWSDTCTEVKMVPVGDNQFRAEVWLYERCKNCGKRGAEIEFVEEYNPEDYLN